jgi:hypothetical protein
VSVYYKQAYKGRVVRRKVGVGAALTQTTQAMAHVTIAIPAGKGGNLIEVAVNVKGDLETIVNSGGLMTIRNSSADWVPFESMTPVETCLTVGATSGRPFRIPCSKYLPGNSSVYVDYWPYDDQSQYLEVELKWLMGVKPKVETFSICTANEKWKVASRITSTARTNWGTMAIPGAKGGQVYMLMAQRETLLTTAIVGCGSLIEWENDAFDAIPTMHHTTVPFVLTEGGEEIPPDTVEHSDICPANSTWTCYGTSNDATAAHTIACCIFWKRPYTG